MGATQAFRDEHAHLLEQVARLRELAATLPAATPAEEVEAIFERMGGHGACH
jgi:hypothetical protein